MLFLFQRHQLFFVLQVFYKDLSCSDCTFLWYFVQTPAYIIFGVKYDVNILLLKAKYLTEVEVFPVPHGAWVGTEGQIQVSSEELKNYINEKTVMLSDSQLQQTENNTNTDNNTEEQNG